LWQLIEMLKAVSARERADTPRAGTAATRGLPRPSKGGDRHTAVEDDEVPF
jgi:hypothetical protein